MYPFQNGGLAVRVNGGHVRCGVPDYGYLHGDLVLDDNAELRGQRDVLIALGMESASLFSTQELEKRRSVCI